MLQFSILQIFETNIGKHFCMNTSMSCAQQQMLLRHIVTGASPPPQVGMLALPENIPI